MLQIQFIHDRRNACTRFIELILKTPGGDHRIGDSVNLLLRSAQLHVRCLTDQPCSTRCKKKLADEVQLELVDRSLVHLVTYVVQVNRRILEGVCDLKRPCISRTSGEF